MMAPFFRVLTASVRDPAQAAAAVQDYAFQGMAIDAAGMSERRIEQLVRSVRRFTTNVVVHSISEEIDRAWLRKLGVTHVTYRRDAALAGLTPGASVPASPRPEQAPGSTARRATG